jgi:penicillin-binding protein 1A
MREALVHSRNLVSIRILKAIGIQSVIDYVPRFGFDPKTLPHDLTMALGTMEVTPLDLAAAYAVFANGGYRVQPYFIERIEDAAGALVWRAAPKRVCPQCEPAASPAVPGEQGAAAVRVSDDTHGEPAPLPPEEVAPRVITPQNAYVMDDMMADVIKRGTGVRARALGRSDIGGKTGTTNEAKDTWFNGFTPNLVATVWVGFDQERPLGDAEEGAHTALPIWISFMAAALKGVTEQHRPMPDGIVTLRISPDNGTLVSAENPTGMPELFMADRLPSAEDAATVTQGQQAQASGQPIF